MSTSFAESWTAARRLFILRLLVELGGEANEGVITSAARSGGFRQTAHDDIIADLDHLRRAGATAEEWIDTLRIARITERGEDIAYGRIAAGGVQHEIWRRP